MRRTKPTRAGRLLTYGGTGFALAVAAIMALAPASAGAGTHLTVVLKAPYKGTVSQPNIFTDLGGCATLKTVTPKWAATTGLITASAAGTAHTCSKSIGYVGGSSFSYGGPGISVAIPFKVGSNGNHSVSEAFTLTIASSSTFAAPSCKLNVNYAPAKGSYSYGYCEAGSDVSVYINAQLFDQNNNSFSTYNYSYADVYNDSYTENYSYCYNYAGTPSCYNNNGTHTYTGSFGYHVTGAISMNGVSTFTSWNNGTMMVKGHHYAVIFQISISCDTFAQKYNVIGLWSGSASGSVNMGTLGNGAKLNSVTIT